MITFTRETAVRFGRFFNLKVWIVPAALLPLMACPTTGGVARERVPGSMEFARIKVALAVDTSWAVVSIDSPFTIHAWPDPGDRPVAAVGKPLRNSVTLAAPDGIQIGTHVFGTGALRIRPAGEDALVVNGVRYAGELLLMRNGENRMDLVNLVDQDDYIASVIGGEMPASWPAEALKAQAVAARTYAMYMMRQRGREGKSYDVFNGVADQAYGGVAAATDTTRSAAEATRDLVMKSGGELFKAYFHSTCGGSTDDVSLIFGDRSLRPLSGVRCGFCTASPRYAWHATLSKADVERKLNDAGYRVGIVGNLLPGRRAAGRLITVIVSHSGGSLTIPADRFRKAIGTTEVLSTNFVATDGGSTITLTGFGFGHGVGMCQWGAGTLAGKWSFTKILRFYYPGVAIGSLNSRDFK